MSKFGFTIVVLALVLAIGVAGGVLGTRMSEPVTRARQPESAATPVPPGPAQPPATPAPVVLPPQPTPTPDNSRQLVGSFATSHQGVSQQWDSFRKDYQAWRVSETSCSATSMTRDLRDWVTRFDGLRDRAARLNRTSQTRPVVDALTDVANQQDQALQQLRDSWRPGDQGVFTVYEQDLQSFQQSRRGVIDQAARLKTVKIADQQATMAQFSANWDGVASSWDAFHNDWDAWRGREASRAVSQTAADLQAFTQRFQAVFARLQALPRQPVVVPAAEAFIRAGDRETGALVSLRDRFKPDDPSLFETFERQRRIAMTERRAAVDALTQLEQRLASERQEELGAFNDTFATLTRDWDAFSNDYTSWRNQNGNCKQDDVSAKLDGFVQKFRSIMASVQA
ncbi:MAG: hypothetical protein HYX97_02000, partial [Chloroflexi bacterium]|nr:hypothetical protein [Chloroflexota bacterium]